MSEPRKVHALFADNCIDILELVLAKARAGEVQSLAVAYVLVEPEGEFTEYRIGLGKNSWRDALSGCISRMLWRLHQTVEENS